MMNTWKLWPVVTGMIALLLAGCSTVTSNRGPDINLASRWVLLPSINNTETPQAGGRLDSITASMLHVHGVGNLGLYPAANQGTESLFEAADRRAQESALEWARKQGAQYAVAGSVEEWRYKVGLDGEPAVGISLNVIEVASGRVIWSGTAARSGWSRQSVSAVAQKAVDDLLDDALSHAR